MDRAFRIWFDLSYGESNLDYSENCQMQESMRDRLTELRAVTVMRVPHQKSARHSEVKREQGTTDYEWFPVSLFIL